MRVSQLMRSEPATHPNRDRGVARLFPDSRRRARPTVGQSASDAEQSVRSAESRAPSATARVAPTQRSIPTSRRLSPLPCRTSRRAAVGVKIGLVERECLADPQAGAPENYDHAAQPDAVEIISCCVHHRNDLLNGGRIRWIPKPPIAGGNASVKAGRRRRRAAPTGAVEQRD
jgi:hypothetical protein